MKFFKNIPHAEMGSLALLCTGVVLLLAAAFVFSTQQQEVSSQAAATVLGDQQGIPRGYTGQPYPDLEECWVTQAGPERYGPPCLRNEAVPFNSGVFSAHVKGVAEGLTVLLRTDRKPGYEETPHLELGQAKADDCDFESHTCGNYSCDRYNAPPGYSDVHVGHPPPDRIEAAVVLAEAGDNAPNDNLEHGKNEDPHACYAVRFVPPTVTSSTATFGSPVQVTPGDELSLEWSCLPKRDVNIQATTESCFFNVFGGIFCRDRFTTGQGFRMVPVTTSVAGTGPGFVSPSSLRGSVSFVPPEGAHLYTLTCRGFNAPTMSIPVMVGDNAFPAPRLSISTDAPVVAGVPTITVGSSAAITATYRPQSSGTITDTLVASAINGPDGTSAIKGAGWDDPAARKTYTFEPSVPGDYTFTPAAKTTYYPTWNNYGASLAIHVVARPGTDVCSNITGRQSAPPAHGYVSGTRCLCDPGYDLDATAGTCTLAQEDLCTGASFPGVQSVLPQHAIQNDDGTCSCEDGYTLSGGACVAPTIGEFYVNPSLVRAGNTTTLYWKVTNPPPSCRITGTDGSSRTIPRASLANGSVFSDPINETTVFTMRCGTITKQATVRIIPVFEER